MSVNPIFCAIDRADRKAALKLARDLAPHVAGLKVGLEFVTANGPDGVRDIVGLGRPVFLDLKFHDIPNTVAGAVRSAAGLGAAMLTIHASGGRAMLDAAVGAANDFEPRPDLVGVTVLTSLDDDDLEALGIDDDVLDHALRLADLAQAAGLDGVVCSPHELEALRPRVDPDFKLVVPGIRPRGSKSGDQKRTMTPKRALALGADALVVGRPITAADDPVEAARAIANELSGGG
jgi:orotidine-5'-phosphate decarboxylase